MFCQPYEVCFEFSKQKVKIGSCTDQKSSTKYLYRNNSLDELTKYQIDGCLILDDSSKCDYLLMNCTKKIAYFIELKGSDLIKAIEQIDQTVDRLSKDIEDYTIEARIVLTRVNTIDLKNSKLIRLEKKLRKYKGKLIKKSKLLTEIN